ncbi:MAG TPA: hypothetical protein VK210_13610 [Terriglobia bacterium]|nr:hypothetical protein [Terriglobia bacterium]
MAFLIVPNEVDTKKAVVWVASINEPFDATTAELLYGAAQLPLHDKWIDFKTSDGKDQIQYQRVTLPNLTPGTNYPLTLRVSGQDTADASVRTLPDRLPVTGERPFTVLLGSCYFGRQDKSGRVGQTFFRLPNDAKPDIKILCGDQVYLDNPPQDFIIPRGHNWLQSRSFRTYAASWTQTTPGGGFNELLKRNANFFSSDDHEFWNNAPDFGLNVPTFTLTQGQRTTWQTIGRELYRVFQNEPTPPICFKVGALSFCNADTRFFRERAHGNLLQPGDLKTIGDWIGNLTGPGVLVLGQPYFADKGSIKDWGLPDFQQFPELTRQLRSSQHTIVILTGDVHFGRVAFANLRPELGTKLVEVISSPMKIVSPVAAGKYSPAPQVFGAVNSRPDFSKGRDHFLTLEFLALSASRASMAIKMWPITDGQPQPEIVGDPIELI